jgi:hypothetical protein
MRMILVTITAITGILATLIVGYITHLINMMSMNMIVNGTTPASPEVTTAWGNAVTWGTWAPLMMTLGAFLGLIVWWVMSAQKRETVTGVM